MNEPITVNTAYSVYDSSAPGRSAGRELRRVWRYREMLLELVLRNIRNRYRRSLLGVAWSVLNPLLSMAVLTIVFSGLFRFSLPNYPVYLLSGLIVWIFFSQSTSASLTDMVWGSGLLKRISIPPASFVISAIGTGLVNLLLSSITLVLIVIIFDLQIGPSWLFIPIAILIMTLFNLSVGFLISSLAVPYADIVDLYQVILLAWLYLTPVFYPPEIVPAQFQWLIKINPMTHVIACFRDPIYLGILPPTESIITATLFTVFFLIIGWVLFSKRSQAFAIHA